MKSKLFLFVTPDGVTYSSSSKLEPDVDNYQVLCYGRGETEEEAFEDFKKQNEWVYFTDFEKAICIEVKTEIYDGKVFDLKNTRIRS